jgi:hypothetical protein
MKRFKEGKQKLPAGCAKLPRNLWSLNRDLTDPLGVRQLAMRDLGFRRKRRRAWPLRGPEGSVEKHWFR